MREGAVNSNSDVHGLSIKFVDVVLLITDLTKAVTLSMPTSSFDVIPCLDGSALAWPLHYVTSKTTSGFTLNMASGLAGTRRFMVVQTA